MCNLLPVPSHLIKTLTGMIQLCLHRKSLWFHIMLMVTAEGISLLKLKAKALVNRYQLIFIYYKYVNICWQICKCNCTFVSFFSFLDA